MQYVPVLSRLTFPCVTPLLSAASMVPSELVFTNRTPVLFR